MTSPTTTAPPAAAVPPSARRRRFGAHTVSTAILTATRGGRRRSRGDAAVGGRHGARAPGRAAGRPRRPGASHVITRPQWEADVRRAAPARAGARQRRTRPATCGSSPAGAGGARRRVPGRRRGDHPARGAGRADHQPARHHRGADHRHPLHDAADRLQDARRAHEHDQRRVAVPHRAQAERRVAGRGQGRADRARAADRRGAAPGPARRGAERGVAGAAGQARGALGAQPQARDAQRRGRGRRPRAAAVHARGARRPAAGGRRPRRRRRAGSPRRATTSPRCCSSRSCATATRSATRDAAAAVLGRARSRADVDARRAADHRLRRGEGAAGLVGEVAGRVLHDLLRQPVLALHRALGGAPRADAEPGHDVLDPARRRRVGAVRDRRALGARRRRGGAPGRVHVRLRRRPARALHPHLHPARRVAGLDLRPHEGVPRVRGPGDRRRPHRQRRLAAGRVRDGGPVRAPRDRLLLPGVAAAAARRRGTAAARARRRPRRARRAEDEDDDDEPPGEGASRSKHRARACGRAGASWTPTR